MAGRLSRYDRLRIGRGLPVADALSTKQLKNELIRRGFEVTKAVGDVAVSPAVEGPPDVDAPPPQPEQQYESD